MKNVVLAIGLMELVSTENAEAVLCDMINNIPSYSKCSFSQRRDFCHKVSVQCPSLHVRWINLFAKWGDIANDANAIAIAVQKGYYDLAKHLIDIRESDTEMECILSACDIALQNINAAGTQGDTLNQPLITRNEKRSKLEKLGNFLDYLSGERNRGRIQLNLQEGAELNRLFSSVTNQYGSL